MGLGFRKPKLCYVCYSPDHLIKDCDLHEKKAKQTVKPRPHASKAVLSQSTARPNYPRPIWNNTRRVNHKNFSKKERYSQQKQSYRPQAVLSKQGLQSTAKPFYPKRNNDTSKASYVSSFSGSYNNNKTPNAKRNWKVKQSTAQSQAVLSSK